SAGDGELLLDLFNIGDSGVMAAGDNQCAAYAGAECLRIGTLECRRGVDEDDIKLLAHVIDQSTQGGAAEQFQWIRWLSASGQNGKVSQPMDTLDDFSAGATGKNVGQPGAALQPE